MWDNAISAASKKSNQRTPIQQHDLAAIRRIAQNKEQVNKRYIKNLNTCRQFLQRIRTVLTGQTIETKIMIRHSDGNIYQIDASKLTGKQLQYTLSGYGSSPLNLTYQLDVEMGKLIQEGIAIKISDTDIYNAIWSQKTPYLAKKSLTTGRTYKPVFNSKDAEIFAILIKELEAGAKLNLDLDRYTGLRAITGAGNRTSQFMGGDSGLDQIKIISGQKGQVTLASHAVIRNNLERLISATDPTKSKTEMVQALKEMYINSNQKWDLENAITKEIEQNIIKEAEMRINKLFAGTTRINANKI